ncbi:hypothetical protein [Fibrella aquatilis]|uniref:Uncharacterized protein n=1 Tax=Fibrella aquatilis TaxID=2817059 RepID=A0A939G3G4_9BACT|nr:hypothetical protein [Fibrella aquatilis]MBO0930395.1 hypothetical protein [Fibrella aquatilis]
MTPTEKEMPVSERGLTFLRTMLANKRAEQKKMVEEFKNDPAKQAIVAELRRKNAAKRQAASEL